MSPKNVIAVACLSMFASLSTAACSADTSGGDDTSSAESTQSLMQVKDDGKVDRSRLVPPLPPEYASFDCRLSPKGPICSGTRTEGDLVSWTDIGDFGCDEGPTYAVGLRTIHSVRFYNNDYKMFHKSAHVYATESYSGNPDGSGRTAHGDPNMTEEWVYDTPGMDADLGVLTLTGIEARAIADQGPGPAVAWVDRGQVILYPDGNVTFVRGRWDLWTDFDAARLRLCKILHP